MPLRLIFASLAFASLASAATPLEDAVKLYKEKQYPDARVAFEKIATTEPDNAAACYYLGMTLMRRGDDRGLEDALPWMEKAATLEPRNATYLADYGGIAMLVADKRQSLSSIALVKKGRDAMEKSLTIEPNNLEARVGLWRFYSEAPTLFGLGDSAKAEEHLHEIRQRHPQRAATLLIDSQLRTKKFAEAFKTCEELLAKTPDDFFAVSQHARVSLSSGQNLERALAGLKRFTSLTNAAAAGTANLVLAWVRQGNLHEKLGQVAEARKSYEAALRVQPGDSTAAAALANLK